MYYYTYITTLWHRCICCYTAVSLEECLKRFTEVEKLDHKSLWRCQTCAASHPGIVYITTHITTQWHHKNSTTNPYGDAGLVRHPTLVFSWCIMLLFYSYTFICKSLRVSRHPTLLFDLFYYFIYIRSFSSPYGSSAVSRYPPWCSLVFDFIHSFFYLHLSTSPYGGAGISGTGTFRI